MRHARRVTSVDVLASAVHRVVPSALGRVVDQARLDLNTLASGLRGDREPTFSTPSRPPLRAQVIDDVDPLFHALPSALRSPYTVLRGDLRMLARELRGERTSPVVPRPARRLDRAPAIVLAPRRLEIAALTKETDEGLSISLREPSGMRLSFEPGQFLTVHVSIDGVVHKRAYSLSSTPSDALATITIKRIEGGLVSSYLHRAFASGQLAVGGALEVLGPSGNFLAAPASLPRHLVFFAGGSGITPIASILGTVLSSEPGTRATLVYGNKRERDIFFRDRLEALASAHPDRLRVVHVLEEASPLAARVGRPDAALLEGLLDEHAILQRASGEAPAEYFVCGPRPMMDAVRSVLLARGVSPSLIHEERFQSPGVRRAASSLPTAPVAVTLKKRGQTIALTVAPNQTVLEAALASGVALPFSCSMGGCAACKCTAVEGEMEMEEPNCLTDAERAARQVLTCVGRPLGNVTLEVPS